MADRVSSAQFWQWLVTGLASVGAILAWVAKLWWCREFRDSKEAQIQALREQLKTAEKLRSDKLLEVCVKMMQDSEKVIEKLQHDLDDRIGQMSVLEKELDGMTGVQTRLGETEELLREERVQKLHLMRDHAATLEAAIGSAKADESRALKLLEDGDSGVPPWEKLAQLVMDVARVQGCPAKYVCTEPGKISVRTSGLLSPRNTRAIQLCAEPLGMVLTSVSPVERGQTSYEFKSRDKLSQDASQGASHEDGLRSAPSSGAIEGRTSGD